MSNVRPFPAGHAVFYLSPVQIFLKSSNPDPCFMSSTCSQLAIAPTNTMLTSVAWPQADKLEGMPKKAK